MVAGAWLRDTINGGETTRGNSPSVSGIIARLPASLQVIGWVFLFLVSLDVSDCVTYSGNLFGFFLRNLQVEHLLKFHDELYCVQRIGTKVLAEFSGFNYFVFRLR